MSFKINKRKMAYYFSFFLVLGNLILGSVLQSLYMSDIFSGILLVLALACIYLNVRSSVSFTRSSIFFLYFLFVYIFFVFIRNHSLLGSGITNIVYYSFFAICIFLLDRNTEWIELFYNTLLFLTSIHVFITFFIFLFPGLGPRLAQFNLSGDSLISALNQIEEGKIVGLGDTYSLNATYVSIALGLSIIKVSYTKRIGKKIFLAIIAVVSLFSLLIIGKRAHVVFSLLSIGSLWLFSNRHNIGKKTFYLLMTLMVSAPVALSALPALSSTFLFIQRFTVIEDLKTLGGRTELYSEALRIFRSSPIIGVGWAGYPEIVQNTVGRFYPEQFSRMQAHNIYLQLLAEIGIIGTLFFIYLFYWGVKKSFQMINSHIGKEEKKYIHYSLYLQTFFLLYGFSGNPLYDRPMYIPYFFSLLALVSISSRSQTNIIKEL